MIATICVCVLADMYALVCKMMVCAYVHTVHLCVYMENGHSQLG